VGRAVGKDRQKRDGRPDASIGSRTHRQNHDITAEVAGVGVARDRLREAGIATPL
jgi:hypothetical protein